MTPAVRPGVTTVGTWLELKRVAQSAKGLTNSLPTSQSASNDDKFFVYKCRANKLKPTFDAFINSLKHIYVVDKHVHFIEMTYEKFVKKWTPHNYLVICMCLMTFVCTSVNLIYLTCVLFETMYTYTQQMFISCVSMLWWQNMICNTTLPE